MSQPIVFYAKRLGQWVYRKATRPRFVFNGVTMPYWIDYRILDCERAVEIPIAMSYVWGRRKERILEVGDVLNHFCPFPHTVVDKYSPERYAVNADIAHWEPNAYFDVIVSISTMEHVGHDEVVGVPEPVASVGKATHGFWVMRDCLAKGGVMVATIPVGYNPDLDHWIEHGWFGDRYYLRRVSADNRWVDCTFQQTLGHRQFGKPYSNGNVLCVLVYAR